MGPIFSSCFAGFFTACGWEGAVSREAVLKKIEAQMPLLASSPARFQSIPPFAQLQFDKLKGTERILIIGTENDEAVTFCQARGCNVYVHDDELQINGYKNALSDAHFYENEGGYRLAQSKGIIYTSGGDEFDLVYACGRISQMTVEEIEKKLGTLKPGGIVIGDVPLKAKDSHWYLSSRADVLGLFEGKGTIEYCDYDRFCCSGNVNFILQILDHPKAH